MQDDRDIDQRDPDGLRDHTADGGLDHETLDPHVEPAGETEPLIVAAGHPSLDGAVGRFVDEVAAGVSAPRRTHVAAAISIFMRTGDGTTLAAVADGRIVGLGRATEGGGAELLVVPGADGRDARPALLHAINERAAAAATERPAAG